MHANYFLMVFSTCRARSVLKALETDVLSDFAKFSF